MLANKRRVRNPLVTVLLLAVVALPATILIPEVVRAVLPAPYWMLVSLLAIAGVVAAIIRR